MAIGCGELGGNLVVGERERPLELRMQPRVARRCRAEARVVLVHLVPHLVRVRVRVTVTVTVRVRVGIGVGVRVNVEGHSK